ncbi:hypothetical protein BDN70DRAFT_934364 [Pholiota conissans]|uniref:DUF6699 domain-containing protein n=1 Tax=Pholiota conissans TaxID=109636 RepID=A0A9P5Z082_9AGAR|nr:hypothetical protein BDN70DRAFT_934364 [Pholiota conissans]
MDSIPMPPPISTSHDPNPPFYPPPHGATDGGQPGFFSAFPGAQNSSQSSSSPWPAPQGTPYPPSSAWPLGSPISAPAWGTAGYYPPAGPPLFAPQPQPPIPAAWGGQYTPAANNTAYHPPSAGPYHPPTPYFTGQPPPPTPYEPTTFTANPTNGWYNMTPQQPQSAGVGGDTYVRVKKPKRRNSKYRRDDYDDDYDENEGAGGIGYSVSMKRTMSQANPKNRPPLQRSASWGHVGQAAYANMVPPAYARGDLWDEHNLARRPRDWRADFTGREGLAGYLPQMLPSVLKPKTDVRGTCFIILLLLATRTTILTDHLPEWTDSERRDIHPLLLYKPPYPPIDYDLRNASAPFDPGMITFATLDRPHNDIDLAQLACQPASSFMRLLHPRLPWYIDVYSSHPNGVTVFDIFRAITAQLGTPIHGRHFWNESLSAGDRAAITAAFQLRCRGREALIPRGVLQVDFLGDKCLFQGLVRGAHGMWEIKTTKP